MAATGELEAETRIDTLLPLATAGQSVVARASLPNADGRWRPGMTVNAEVTVAERRVPLAVRESGLQGFRDFTVVFAQIGETYEVRMLELGARDGAWVEVLGGLKPGTNRSEEHTSELQSLMRISYAVFCLKKKKQHTHKSSCQNTLS